MIHINASRGPSPAEDILHFSLRGTSTIREFQALLDRSLNCLPPEKQGDWISLSDRIYMFLHPEVAAAFSGTPPRQER